MVGRRRGAGVDILQIRERGLGRRARAAGAGGAGGGVRHRETRVLVNDRIDVAIATGAAGVHLPSSAPPAAMVRRIVPTGFLIGRSVHADDDVAALERAGGCDYLTFGTVFRSAGKPADHQPAGIEALRRPCAATQLPVLAIGGITVAVAAQRPPPAPRAWPPSACFSTTGGRDPAGRCGRPGAADWQRSGLRCAPALPPDSRDLIEWYG